jgi:hypothetical protein
MESQSKRPGRSGSRSIQEFFEPDYTTEFLDSESELTDAEFELLIAQDIHEEAEAQGTFDDESLEVA